VSNAELQERAEALSRQWEMVSADTNASGLPLRLASLKERLTEILRACRKTASLQELTPQLELLESTRMLESVLIAGDETNATFASLPHVRVDGDKQLPRVVNLTEGYLSAAKGIWSPESLTT
jgi:cyclic beta-1,2-glucan synthetase